MLSEDFETYFEELIDPRVRNHNFRHEFMDILVLALVAVIAGCDDWIEIEDFLLERESVFRAFLSLEYGIPRHDTFRRVFAAIDSKEFERLFADWMHHVCKLAPGTVVAIDGKTLCGARFKGSLKGLHLVQAFACENKLTLGIVKSDAKSNEITAIPKLLKMLRIPHCTVTIDAMGCQKEIAELICNKKAHYILRVKGNQGSLLENIQDLFKLYFDKAKTKYDSGIQEESGHGRVEKRRVMGLPADLLPEVQAAWHGIKSFVKVEHKRTVKGKSPSHESFYYISSHVYHSPMLVKGTRSHWLIENQLHWVLDVTFKEDHQRARIKNEAENLAMLRRLALGELKNDPETLFPGHRRIGKVSYKRRRKLLSWNNDYLMALLTRLLGQPINCEQ